MQKQHREKKTLHRPNHLYNYQHVVLHTDTKTFSLIIETYDLYNYLIMEREIVKISVKLSLPATEVEKIYLYICICMCIYITFSTLLPTDVRTHVYSRSLFRAHTESSVFWCSKNFATVKDAISN